jgi:hypothetical protein
MTKSAAAACASLFLILVTACAPVVRSSNVTPPRTFYVSPDGKGTTGLSWVTAWRDTSLIDWPAIPSGSKIVIDGGDSACSASPYDYQLSSPDPGVTCGMRYRPLSVGRDDVIIERSTAPGRDGTVVIDGGRDTPLPYCGQGSYSAAAGSSAGIDLNGHSKVMIDGMARSGIVVRGARDGIVMGSGGHNALRNIEIFDNGYAIRHPWGYSSDGNGVLMGGMDNVYDRLLVHDNGQDEFHSDNRGYNESGSAVSNSWLGAMRENPRYAGEPFNDLQASGHDPGCTHADAVQIFAPGITMNKLSFDYDVFGPGVNQGLYPSDGGTGTTFDDVAVRNSLFLDAASSNIVTDTRVHGWNLSYDTLFATQGGIEIPGNGENGISHVVKYGGKAYGPGGSWVVSDSIWYEGDPLPGAAVHSDPGFASVPTGILPGLASIRAADLAPQATSDGSPLHSWRALLARIDLLNDLSGQTALRSPVTWSPAAGVPCPEGLTQADVADGITTKPVR